MRPARNVDAQAGAATLATECAASVYLMTQENPENPANVASRFALRCLVNAIYPQLPRFLRYAPV